MTDGGLPTAIYFVTGTTPRGKLFHLTGPLRSHIKGYTGGSGIAWGVKVWKLVPPGWRDVTSKFLDEEGYLR